MIDINDTKIEKVTADIGEVVEHLFPGITADLHKFLAECPYGGQAFDGFDRFELCEDKLKALHVVPRGLEEDDIYERDSDFDKALTKLGNKHGVMLHLPHWAYKNRDYMLKA